MQKVEKWTLQDMRFSVWSVYSVTYTSLHLNSKCIYDLHMIAIANKEWSIMLLSMFLKNQLYSLQ